MEQNYKICCCTGHRPHGFRWNYYHQTGKPYQTYINVLSDVIEQYIISGFNYFISVGAIGVDIDFAECVLALRKKYPHIRLEISVPCVNQERKWKEQDKIRYRSILQLADQVEILSPSYTPWCMERRNQYMVNKAELVLAVWNTSTRGGTYNTIQYARKKQKKLDYIMLPALDNQDYNEETRYVTFKGND